VTVLVAAIAVALSALAAPAAAGSVFRVVGPDGRVTYTDRPPGAASAATPSSNASTGRDALVAAPAAVAGPLTQGQHDLLMALIGVEAVRESVREAGLLCERMPGPTAAHFTRAEQDWQGRNLAYHARSDRLLTDGLQPEQRQYLHDEVKRRVTTFMLAVRAATPAERSAWCERSAGEIDRGDLDVAKQATWPALLMGAKGR
jgi:hypothetical protein